MFSVFITVEILKSEFENPSASYVLGLRIANSFRLNCSVWMPQSPVRVAVLVCMANTLLDDSVDSISSAFCLFAATVYHHSKQYR